VTKQKALKYRSMVLLRHPRGLHAHNSHVQLDIVMV